MSWIIDTSGPTADVIEFVTKLQFDSFRAEKREQIERRQAERKLASGPRPDLDLDINAIEAELARMDEGDERMFGLAKVAVLAALANLQTSHAGVCARAYKNPNDAPRGQTFHVSVAGYDGL